VTTKATSDVALSDSQQHVWCVVSPRLHGSPLLTLRRKKHVYEANPLTDCHGSKWLFCPGRVSEFSVRPSSCCPCHHSSSLSTSIHEYLLTRLSNDDDMEKNLSTFANEMASSAMILGLASSQSFVLIDELG